MRRPHNGWTPVISRVIDRAQSVQESPFAALASSAMGVLHFRSASDVRVRRQELRMYPIPSYHPSEILQAKIRLAALEDRQTDAEILSKAAQLYFRIRQELRSGRVIGFVEPDRKDQLAEEIVGI
jgi:hypothetical protein